jgi:integrase
VTTDDVTRETDEGRTHFLQTIQMLREVIDGDPYATVAQRWGLSRSAVDRRIKGLAVQLTQAVGVDGLQESGAAFVKRLRMHRDAILQALEHFDPAQVSSQREARVLKPGEVDLGARRVRSRSTRPLHDLALYYLPFATGLRPLEVARLTVGDYLLEDGSVRRESRVRADVAINGRDRPLFWIRTARCSWARRARSIRSRRTAARARTATSAVLCWRSTARSSARPTYPVCARSRHG